MKRILNLFLFFYFLLAGIGIANADEHMFGIIGGISNTSLPNSSNSYYYKNNYVDGNGGFCYLNRKQLLKGFDMETQVSVLFGSASFEPYNSYTYGSRYKFILPLDFRFFLGSQKLSGYFGAGLQYNCIWKFTEGGNYYYGYYYNHKEEKKPSWEWNANQISTNLALGFKVGFWNGKAWNSTTKKYETFKRNAVMIGTKVHIPIVNNAESFQLKDNDGIDLTKDKVGVSITGGLSFGFTEWFTLKADYEYPIGGSNKVKNEFEHSTWIKATTQSLSITLLFRM